MNRVVFLLGQLMLFLPFLKKSTVERIAIVFMQVIMEVHILIPVFTYVNPFLLFFTELFGVFLLNPKEWKENVIVFLGMKVIVSFSYFILILGNIISVEGLENKYVEGALYTFPVSVVAVGYVCRNFDGILFFVRSRRNVLCLFMVFYLVCESTMMLYLFYPSFMTAMIILLILIMGVLFFCIRGYQKWQNIEILNQFHKKNYLKLSHEDIDLLTNYKEQMMQWKHDLIHQLSELDQQINQASKEQLHQMIQNTVSSLQPEEMISYTSNKFLNQILEIKKKEYPDKILEIIIQATISDDMLFQNLSLIASELMDFCISECVLKVVEVNQMLVIHFEGDFVMDHELIVFMNDFVKTYQGYLHVGNNEISLLLNIEI